MDDHRQILLPIPALFSFDECLWFLNRNYDDCLHIIKGDVIYKALESPPGDVLIRVSEQGSFLNVELLEGEGGRSQMDFLADYVSDWFDLKTAIQPFYDLLAADSRLAYMTELYQGLRLVGIANLYEAICWSIIGQQINLSFAYKCKRALVEQFGRFVEFENERFYIFPNPEILAGVDPEALKAIQFSKQKTDYTILISKAFASGELSLEKLVAQPDFEAKKKLLTSYKGIGIWTANYALMKTLREPKAIPYGDIGLLNALANHNIIQDRKEADKIEALFSQYEGWEGYLVFYLWRSLTVK